MRGDVTTLVRRDRDRIWAEFARYVTDTREQGGGAFLKSDQVSSSARTHTHSRHTRPLLRSCRVMAAPSSKTECGRGHISFFFWHASASSLPQCCH